MDALDELYLALKNASAPMAFTGAGVSTLSGIRDFRGKNGVYREPWRGMAVEDLLSLDVFEQDPSLFYGWAREFVYQLDRFRPGAVHILLAELEAAGMLREVVTQNIDLLHQRAGSRKVCEIHGSPAHHHCRQCGAERSYDEVAPVVMAGEVPHCPSCGGVLKPDIIFYGEGLDERCLSHAFAAMASCDFLLVMGSSLTVQPAASLPVEAARHGAEIVIVNDQPTPLDRLAKRRFSSLEEVAGGLLERLRRDRPGA